MTARRIDHPAEIPFPSDFLVVARKAAESFARGYGVLERLPPSCSTMADYEHLTARQSFALESGGVLVNPRRCRLLTLRVVLTGASGYIGGRLLVRLRQQGDALCAIVEAKDAAPLPDNVARVVDGGCATDLAAELTGFRPDVVLHLAACQDLSDAPSSSDSLVEANVAFGARVLSAACAAGARAFIAAGSYSSHASGSVAYCPQTLYAATKQAFLDIAEHYRSNTTLRTVTLELSDTYGPGDERPKFLNLVATAAATGEILDASPGDQVVRPVHVDDVVSAFLHAARSLLADKPLEPAYSVAGREPVSLRELVAVFEQATAAKVPIRWGARPYRDREIATPWAGNPLPSWEPAISLREGLAAVYGYSRKA